MLMPGERVTVYGRPGGKNSLLVSSAQRGRAFLGTETSRSTVSPGPLDEKVSGATLVDWAAWAASTTFHPPVGGLAMTSRRWTPSAARFATPSSGAPSSG
jgi:hypothetical protein